MYILFPVLLLIMILCSLIFHHRKKRILCKLCAMPVEEKLCQLNELLHPFGFEYLLSQDIFTSRLDAWQRDYGYGWIYDKNASRFNMVFDCQPIYFDYEGCTWMIEFWKGQYGINTGVEIGIYKADTLVPKSKRKTTIFSTIPDHQLPVFEMAVWKDNSPLFRITRRHWWLAGFRMGTYSRPEQLTVQFSVTFASCTMQKAFVQGLVEAGYSYDRLCTCGQQVDFAFCSPFILQPRQIHPIRAAFAQWQNRLFLRLYCFVTRPCSCTLDKLLYLYEYLPFAFRHMIQIHRRRPQRTHSKKGCRKEKHPGRRC